MTFAGRLRTELRKKIRSSNGPVGRTFRCDRGHSLVRAVHAPQKLAIRPVTASRLAKERWLVTPGTVLRSTLARIWTELDV